MPLAHVKLAAAAAAVALADAQTPAADICAGVPTLQLALLVRWLLPSLLPPAPAPLSAVLHYALRCLFETLACSLPLFLDFAAAAPPVLAASVVLPSARFVFVLPPIAAAEIAAVAEFVIPASAAALARALIAAAYTLIVFPSLALSLVAVHCLP